MIGFSLAQASTPGTASQQNARAGEKRRGAPAIFLDKDGTLIENVPYNVDCGKVRLAPGGGDAARMLHEAGYALVVVTNQSGVAMGYFAPEDLGPVERKLRDLLAAEGAPLAGFYFCPHHPAGAVPKYSCPCTCRKPRPGMLLRAAEELSLDLGRSWLIGDILDDIEAAHRADCRAAMVDSGSETVWDLSPPRVPDITAPDLLTAARRILAAGAGSVQPAGNALRGVPKSSFAASIARHEAPRSALRTEAADQEVQP